MKSAPSILLLAAAVVSTAYAAPAANPAAEVQKRDGANSHENHAVFKVKNEKVKRQGPGPFVIPGDEPLGAGSMDGPDKKAKKEKRQGPGPFVIPGDEPLGAGSMDGPDKKAKKEKRQGPGPFVIPGDEPLGAGSMDGPDKKAKKEKRQGPGPFVIPGDEPLGAGSMDGPDKKAKRQLPKQMEEHMHERLSDLPPTSK